MSYPVPGHPNLRVNGRPWTEEEDTTLRHNYRRLGALGVLEKLEKKGFRRTRNAIRLRAQKLGLLVDNTARGDLVMLVDAHKRVSSKAPFAHPRIVEAATRDGVLVRGKVWPHPLMAPEEWVDAYVADLAQEEALEREVKATWLLTRQVARLFGVKYNSLATLATPKRQQTKASSPLTQAIRRIERRWYMTLRPECKQANHHVKTVYWHPVQSHVEAQNYRVRTSRSPWHRARRKVA